MDPLVGLGAAWESLRMAGGLAKVAKDAAVDSAVKDRFIEIQSAILDAQQRLADAQADRLALLEDLAKAQARVRELESAKSALDQYQLDVLGDGVFLYKFVGSNGPAHYACPKCFQGVSVRGTRLDDGRGCQVEVIGCQ